MTYNPIITLSKISKGYGYVSGGTIDGNVNLSTTDKYDDVSNTWAIKADLNTARRHIGAFSLNGYGYTSGGYTNDVNKNMVEKYDDIRNTWTNKTVLTTGTHANAEFTLTGYGYTVAGSNGVITQKYDDVLNTWTTKADHTVQREALRGFSINSYGYISGGTAGVDKSTVERYDDTTNVWVTKTSLNTARYGHSAFNIVYGFISAGLSLAVNIKTVESYDDINNTWSYKTSVSINRSSNTSFSLNGYGYHTNGAPVATSTTEKYDSILNTWTTKTNVTSARERLAGFSIGNLQESIQNPEITQILKSNIRLRANESMVTKIASANARNSHNTEITTISATYTKSKTITFLNGIIGGYRVLFDLKTSDITKTAYGRVYRNGVALGTEQTEAGLAYATKSEDLTTSLSPGDTLELWLHNDGVGTTSAQNFQIAYDDSPTVAVQSSNS